MPKKGSKEWPRMQRKSYEVNKSIETRDEINVTKASEKKDRSNLRKKRQLVYLQGRWKWPYVVAALSVLFNFNGNTWDTQAMERWSQLQKSVSYYRWMLGADNILD